MKQTTRRNLLTIASAALVSSACGFMYPFFFPSTMQPSGPAWHSHTNGLAMGMLIGLALSLGELYLFQAKLRRLRFSFFILAQTMYYLIVIHVIVAGVTILHFVAFHDQRLSETIGFTYRALLHSDDFLKINVYALGVVFTISFMRQVNRMLGQNALVNFVTGKYHTPVEEERVFMFLDLKSSTTIAERLGHTRYHEFLNDFFFDITPAIVESKGEIYQYVGDEVVVTWNKEGGLRNAECLNCYFRISDALKRLTPMYQLKYGFAPSFKAGYHFGRVITGLIGDIKRDLVFHGDTVNTAARIRSECTVVQRDLLMSGHLLERLPLSRDLVTENMGKIKLRGKTEEIELFSLKEAA